MVEKYATDSDEEEEDPEAMSQVKNEKMKKDRISGKMMTQMTLTPQQAEGKIIGDSNSKTYVRNTQHTTHTALSSAKGADA